MLPACNSSTSAAMQCDDDGNLGCVGTSEPTSVLCGSAVLGGLKRPGKKACRLR